MKITGLSLLLLLLPTAALAQPSQTPKSSEIAERVNTHLERGIEFYAEKQYELAIVEFRAGYALDPRPDFLFALAQAERLSGDCPTAVVYYQRFLETGPDANQAEAARVNMKRCRRALESGPGGRAIDPAAAALEKAESAAEPAPPAVPAPPAARADTTDAPPPWYRDPLGGGLAASSLIGLGLGAGFWMAKSGAEDDAANATGYLDYEDALDRARRSRTISLISLGAGVGLAAAATYRYLQVKSRRPERRATLSVAPAPGGGGAVTLSGWF